MKIEVHVTQEHIDSAGRAGKWKMGTWTANCPVARALRDALQHTFPPGSGFSVGFSTWKVYSEAGELLQGGFLPDKTERFIKRVDSNLPVEPFSFQIEVSA